MPPFVLITDWGMMLPTYVALVAIFVAAVAVLNLKARRLNLHSVARVEGY